MTGTRKAFANPAVVLREEFDDWAVLYNPDTAAASGINPVGVAIFKLLDGAHTLEQIVESIRAEFPGAPERVGDEVAAFIEGLVEKGYAGYETEGAPGGGAPAR